MATASDFENSDADSIANQSDQNEQSDFSGFETDEALFNARVLGQVVMDQAGNDRISPIDEEIGWERNDTPPLNAPFTGIPGLKVDLPEDPTPMDFFNLMFDEAMWDTIVVQTNLYARNRITNDQLSRHSRLTKWTDVNVDEMKVFFALVFAMGIVRKPDIADYWISEECIKTPFFGEHMAKDRFLNILGNLHLVNNAEGEEGNDPLYKLRVFINMLKNNFDKYSPEENLSIDEGTCPFKGRVKFRVYNPAKPNKWGIKLYQVCESSSGYCIGFDIYDGSEGCTVFAESVGVDDDATKTTKIVVGLLARCGLLGKGHRVYLDNYYTSPELADELDANDTYMCGTVKKNRRNMPKVFSQIKLKSGDSIFRRKGNTLVIKHNDKRDVHMISTFHEASYSVTNKPGRNGQAVLKPTPVVDYCKNMGGVDLSDQILQYYDVLRRTLKWWKKLFFHLLNLMLVNAYKLYRKLVNGQRRRSHVKFRADIVNALIESATEVNKPKRKVGRKPTPVGRLHGHHFPVYIPAKQGAKRKRPVRDCVACNPGQSKRVGFKRQQSSYMCDKCEVTLCVPECFRVYHTHKNYKRILQSDEDAAASGNNSRSSSSDSSSDSD